MELNYSEDTMKVGRTTYDLKEYRRWLLNEHPVLCQNHFIKAIRKEGKTVFTYDWMSIYSTAREYRLHVEFIKQRI